MDNEYLINNINARALLSNALLEKLTISNNDGKLVVELNIKFMHNNELAGCHLRMGDVQEFHFSYEKNYYFYSIDYYKLLITGEGEFYLSLDPDESTEKKIESDQDYVLAKDISGEIF